MLQCYWIFTGPTTLFPDVCTDAVPGGGSVPVFPVLVTGPVTLLPLTSSPALLPVRLTGPMIVLPAHSPVTELSRCESAGGLPVFGFVPEDHFSESAAAHYDEELG